MTRICPTRNIKQHPTRSTCLCRLGSSSLQLLSFYSYLLVLPSTALSSIRVILVESCDGERAKVDRLAEFRIPGPEPPNSYSSSRHMLEGFQAACQAARATPY